MVAIVISLSAWSKVGSVHERGVVCSLVQSYMIYVEQTLKNFDLN